MPATETYSPLTSAVVGRYNDAYVIVRALTALGDTTKALGIAAGAVIALPSLIIAAKGLAGIVVGFAGIVFAVCIAAIIYLLGLLVSAQGQILKATLDTAVYSSTFLTNDERARIMLLPRVTVAGGSGSTAPPSAAIWKCVCGRPNEGHLTACATCGEDRAY